MSSTGTHNTWPVQAIGPSIKKRKRPENESRKSRAEQSTHTHTHTHTPCVSLVCVALLSARWWGCSGRKWGGSGGGRIGWSFPLLYGCVNRLDWQSVACAHAHDMYFRLLGSQVGRLGSLLGEENKNFSEALEKTKILSLPSSIEPVNLSTCQRILSENGLTG